MIATISFALGIFLVAYFLPIIIFKGARGHAIQWSCLIPFALGVTRLVLYFCGIY